MKIAILSKGGANYSTRRLKEVARARGHEVEIINYAKCYVSIEKNQISVDPRTFETSIPRVFAVGDVCNFDGKLKLIATGVGEAVTAVCFAKQALEPEAKFFPGHSSDRDA